MTKMKKYEEERWWWYGRQLVMMINEETFQWVGQSQHVRSKLPPRSPPGTENWKGNFLKDWSKAGAKTIGLKKGDPPVGSRRRKVIYTVWASWCLNFIFAYFDLISSGSKMAICTSLIFCGAKSVWAGMRSLYSGDRVLDRGVNTQQLQTARFHKRNLEEEKFVKCSTDTNAHSNTECPNCPHLILWSATEESKVESRQ